MPAWAVVSSSMRRRKVRSRILYCVHIHTDKGTYVVDENLFYKGVDKRAVPAARLQQSHSLAEPHQDTPQRDDSASSGTTALNSNGTDEVQPFHPFTSGDSLLSLTRKHNVSPVLISATESL